MDNDTATAATVNPNLLRQFARTRAMRGDVPLESEAAPSWAVNAGLVPVPEFGGGRSMLLHTVPPRESAEHPGVILPPTTKWQALLEDPTSFGNIGGPAKLAAAPLAMRRGAKFPMRLVEHTDEKMRDVAAKSLEAKGVRNITDADIRSEIARHNASLPEKKGGLGLPETNTAEDRAKALGFEEENVYHGSLRGDIREFKPSEYGTDESYAGRGVYTTSEPGDASVNYASAYGPDPKSKITHEIEQRGNDLPGGVARAGRAYFDEQLSPERLEKIVRGTGQGDTLGVVYPLRLRRGVEVDMNARRGEGPRAPSFLTEFTDEGGGDLTEEGRRMQNALARHLSDPSVRNEVFSGVSLEDEPWTMNELRRSIAKRVNDAGVYSDVTDLPVPGAGVAADVLGQLGVNTLRHRPEFGNPMLNMAEAHNITLNPADIRSPFAAFDPARKAHADMLGFSRPGALAGLAGMTGGGAYLAHALRNKKLPTRDEQIEARLRKIESPDQEEQQQ